VSMVGQLEGDGFLVSPPSCSRSRYRVIRSPCTIILHHPPQGAREAVVHTLMRHDHRRAEGGARQAVPGRRALHGLDR
jgi:hypothetical protein